MQHQLPPSLAGKMATSNKHHGSRDRSRISLELSDANARWFLGLIKEQMEGMDRVSPEFANAFAVYKSLKDKIAIRESHAT